MIKLQELKQGDIVRVEENMVEREGIVIEISREENMVCIDNGVQEFWYSLDQVAPIPLTEQELFKLGFEKADTEEGTKYMKGPFRILVHDPGNYTNLDIWYREDRRHFSHPIYIHELQNLHLQMTKVPLERSAVH
jgi:predicted AAA+ superfamily ATPase